jgi:hypothetical protein
MRSVVRHPASRKLPRDVGVPSHGRCGSLEAFDKTQPRRREGHDPQIERTISICVDFAGDGSGANWRGPSAARRPMTVRSKPGRRSHTRPKGNPHANARHTGNVLRMAVPTPGCPGPPHDACERAARRQPGRFTRQKSGHHAGDLSNPITARGLSTSRRASQESIGEEEETGYAGRRRRRARVGQLMRSGREESRSHWEDSHGGRGTG